MKTEKQIQKMYKYAKEIYEDWLIDIYELKNAYNDICEEFNLDIAFWIDWNEYPWDDELYVYTHINCIWSLVFDWWVKWINDENSFMEAVDYILDLEETWIELKNKLLNPKQEQNETV